MLDLPAALCERGSMPNHNDIRSRVEAFTTDLTALIRQAALDAVQQALGEGRAARATLPAKRRPGRPAGKTRAAAKPARASAPRGKARKPGEKRDPKVLAALVEKLFGYIKAHPGQRIEPIGVGLGIATKDLALPVKKLLAAKRITSKGQKRATTYAAAASGGLVLLKKRKKAAEGKAEAASK